MKTFLRVLSVFLVVAMCAGMLPVVAMAEDSIESGVENVSMEGTNSLGEILTNTIETSSLSAAGEYAVTDIKVNGTMAEVSFRTDGAAIVVAAIYTEDGVDMLGSGVATVAPGDTTATVEIEIYAMPSYFLAEAFLLDAATYEPLCPQYTSRYYTKQFQDFLASTVEDYDEERVLNLDEDSSTNFVVFREDTILIEEASGANIVTDSGDGTYVIENADEKLLALTEGACFACTMSDGEVLIVKAESIKIDGTTVTVMEDAQAELSDAFEIVKIQGDSSQAAFEVDTSTMSEGVVYEGMIAGASPMALDFEGNVQYHFGTSYRFNFIKFGDISVFGEFAYGAAIELEAYVSPVWQYISFDLDYSVEGSVGISAQIAEFAFNLAEAKAALPFGVVVSFTPQVVFEASAELSVTYSYGGTIGFIYDSQYGFTDTSVDPDKNGIAQIEGELFCGFRLKPSITLVTEDIASIYVDIDVGIKITATAILWEMDGSGYRHDCDLCFAGNVYFHAGTTVTFTMMKGFLEADRVLAERDILLGEFYWSVDRNEYAWTTCPHISYRVRVTVTDGSGAPFAGAVIQGTGLDSDPVTDTKGKAEFYLPNGAYTLEISQDAQVATQSFIVKNKERVISISARKLEVVANGTCGETMNWLLYDNGHMVISGSGHMTSYFSSYSNPPWKDYASSIFSIEVQEGVASIGSRAFHGLSKLEKVSLPDTTKTVPYKAFSGCSSLEEIVFSENTTSLDMYAFEDCTSLKYVELPETVKTLESYAFRGCTGLQSVKMPDILSEIGDYAFDGCTSLVYATLPKELTVLGCNAFSQTMLESVVVPSGVTAIDSSVFYECAELVSVQLPEGLESIGAGAFYGCKKLEEVNIPMGVVEIGDDAFSGCESLVKITIPSSVTTFGYEILESCESLKEVSLPEGMTEIPEGMLRYCKGLKTVKIPGTVTAIADAAFEGCKSLETIELPDGLTSIGVKAFDSCTALETIELPDGIEEIPVYCFYGCTLLEGITLPENLTGIGDSAFYNCIALREIDIPDSVTEIGASAFYKCTALEKITLGSGLTSIGNEAFWRTDVLTEVHIPSILDWMEIVFADTHASPLPWGEGDFYIDGEKVTNVVIPDGVTTIDENRFFHGGFSAVTIPVSVTAIENSAFYYCRSLKTVYYGGTEEQWAEITIGEYNDDYFLMADIVYGAAAVSEENLLSAENPSVEEVDDREEILSSVPEVLPEVIPVDEKRSSEPNVTEETETVPEEEEHEEAGLEESPMPVFAEALPVQLLASYTGGMSVTDGIATMEYSDLVPGEEYVLIVSYSEYEEPLGAYNRWFISQKTADENGCLTFSFSGESWLVAKLYGRSSKDLKDAQFLVRHDEQGASTLLVIYEDEILLEGEDFDLYLEDREDGTANITAAGKNGYAGSGSVTLCGLFYDGNGGSFGLSGQAQIQNGELTLSSSVPERRGFTFLGWSPEKSAETAEYIPGDALVLEANMTLYAVWKGIGDVNGDDSLDVFDLVRLMKYLIGAETDVVESECDTNRDESINIQDAVCLVKTLAAEN